MTQYVTQPTNMPTRKVTWATLAAVSSSILADILISALPALSMVDPTDLELLIEIALVGFATLAAGWLVRERA
jgi:hypothetical protein